MDTWIKQRKHGIYLNHDGIHYNALRLRDNQEEDGQNEESNNKESTSNPQQRRTKEYATPIIQNNHTWRRRRHAIHKHALTLAHTGQHPGARRTHTKKRIRCGPQPGQRQGGHTRKTGRVANHKRALQARLWLGHKWQNKQKRKTKIR